MADYADQVIIIFSGSFSAQFLSRLAPLIVVETGLIQIVGVGERMLGGDLLIDEGI